MALTCSVLGHAYGEPTVERDREERGSEVVVTIREYETCSRCGTSRVVSENKEVTAVETDAADEQAVTERRTDLDVEEAEDVGVDVEAAETDLEGADVTGPDDEVEGGEDPDEGAEILDAEADAPVDEELAEPSIADSDPEELEPAEEENDAVVIDEEVAVTDDDRAPGEWPDDDEADEEPDWEPASEPSDESLQVEQSFGQTITVPEGEFHCEECGYSTPVESSSLREGDFCPECHQGTLTHVREE